MKGPINPMKFADARGPEGLRLYAIGDIHGRLDLLQDMHGLIRADIDARPTHDWRIIHLGDYVDRGPDSRGVLDFLIKVSKHDPRMLALLGNHEAGFLQYLATGEVTGLFAANGGEETARSYGVEIDFTQAVSAQEGHSNLVQAVPQAHIDFIRSLPRSLAFEDFFFCHAGVNPSLPLDAQDPDELIWIRNIFLGWTGLFEKVIIHGHTPQDAIDIHPNRVNLDTHAWKSGRLSAIIIDGAEKHFLEALD
ncbi:serine/threonine protein phosphatase [Falsochrobactrum sp. TDYN1]|uniref:Serine/threonine protein phosphatase n=1 Tax=Falsochrobactrum tianjinense TaxID=2706015 RepID=A0A949PL63_9HYPH|nr:metallophosphoesterase family protein [Falsochrobactrum sp. TDYN1]MBV2143063.1 serine/threonine protein phosphatase [Falsochrobactrum sp. TDYN1]